MKSSATTPFALWYFGFVTSLLPLLTIHFCWVLASGQGYLDWCNPYWAECYSISATGREGISYFVFKGGMIPAMVLLSLFWWLNQRWLSDLKLTYRLPLGWLGFVASLALILYSLSLGHTGELYFFLRRTGVILYLGLTFMVEVAVSGALASHPQFHIKKTGQRLVALCAVTLVASVVSLIADAWMGEDYDRWENAVEWWLVLLLNLHVIALAALWWRQKLKVSFHSEG